jgi:pimeloyl-ACP methyl ester carboxylesterase
MAMARTMTEREEGLVHVGIGSSLSLAGNLLIPRGATGIVLFAHGSGSSRFSTRNRSVASFLREGALATLLIDLLTPEEERIDDVTAQMRFDIGMLAGRLVSTAEWLGQRPEAKQLRLGVFGASTGGGAALVAAARRPERIHAVVSRGGRPDLAGEALPHVKAPTLLIVGGDDGPVIRMNREAYDRMTAVRKLEIVPGASHLFEEPGTLERVAQLARDGFQQYLLRTAPAARDRYGVRRQRLRFPTAWQAPRIRKRRRCLRTPYVRAPAFVDGGRQPSVGLR